MAVNLTAGKYEPGTPGARAPEATSGRRLARVAFYSSIYSFWILLVFFATGGLHNVPWLAAWNRWDARWYEQIWSQGYPAADPRTLVFPPGYPLVVGGVSKLFSGSFLTTAVILNLVVFFGTAVLIAEWLSRKFGVSGRMLFVFALSAPSAYFAFTAYSDLLFMLLLWLLLWVSLAEPRPQGRRVIVVESALLLILPWVRLTGYALASWLLARRVAALAVVASLGLWLGLNRIIAGKALYFLHAQQLFAMPNGKFFEGLADSLFQLVYSLTSGHYTIWLEFGFLPLFYLVALTAAGAWLAHRREGLLALAVFSILALSYNQGVWRSVVRYDLPLTPVLCLPLLVAMESHSRVGRYFSKAAFYTLTLAQFSLQIYFARLFHGGGWAF